MKYKIIIPAVQHACSKDLGKSLTNDGGDDIQAFLRMLEKHNIPFELIGKSEDTSTPASTVIRKDKTVPIETSEK